jgi:hypothetical protein
MHVCSVGNENESACNEERERECVCMSACTYVCSVGNENESACNESAFNVAINVRPSDFCPMFSLKTLNIPHLTLALA